MRELIETKSGKKVHHRFWVNRRIPHTTKSSQFDFFLGPPSSLPSICDWASVASFLMLLQLVNPSAVIIMEGILLFHDTRVRELMKMKLFVDTAEGLCFPYPLSQKY
ncbi:hypothetical protein NE237_005094 [Protea cynaroides]|uniref:Phosphoribulokinase/uridine kinase domain-containing protein n=1 Tax=Protea cynaroides TaxID=273540 RepID=A0A9Q0QTY3_9MAGN|nr:hypothetical protein NE237_005094 [Protea cynaroides]